MRTFLSLPILLGVLLAVPTRTGAEPNERDRLERAIDSALVALQRQQQPDGSWGAGRGRVAGNAAITALCVMAYLAAGHVPGEGRYGDTIHRGVAWVLRQQNPNGLIASAAGQQEMYHHGICTLMLAEVAGMCDAELGARVRKKLEKGIEVILQAQRQRGEHIGGWRYRVQALDGDISVTGWQVMALRAAKNLGCDVPGERIDQAVAYVKRCRDVSKGGYRYHPRGNLTVPCTGTSILALEICGKQEHLSDDVKQAGNFILRKESLNELRGGGNHHFYGIYYCSQAMFQLGGNYWQGFRTWLHEQLLIHQQPDGTWQGEFGPSYCTAMAVLALTVEYRFLPIYQRDEGPRDR
jgi:hypothetical protein